MNKKQGSAMVLAILLLSFFMALSLNMWYISQKKAQRAGDIVIGNRVLTDIDSSSTLGYYEFYLATEYMVNGFVTSPSSYTLATTTTPYVISTSPVAFSTTYEGISLENERQYFGAYLYTSGSALSTSANAILKKEVIENSKLKSREWETVGVTGAAIKELWESTPNTKSIGGYKIVSINGISYSSPYTLPSATTDILIVYEKEIYFNSNNENKNKSISYIIKVERKIKTDSSGDIDSDSIENITVELQQ